MSADLHVAPPEFYNGLGASLCASILGEDSYRSPYDLWREFTDPAARPDLSGEEVIEAGLMMEPAIAAWAAKKWNITIDYKPGHLVKHATLPYMQCHPDALVVGETAGLECKNRGFQALRIYRSLEEAEEEMDRAQPSETLQCMASMAVTGATHWYLAVAVAGQKLLRFRIERDEAMCKAIEGAYTEFWGYVERNEPPPPINVQDCGKLWPLHAAGRALQATPELVEIAARRRELKEQIKAAKTALDIADFQIESAMGDAEELRLGAKKLLSWKTQNRAHFKLDEFRSEHADLAASFTETKTVRVMR